jgi:hypothetical protein
MSSSFLDIRDSAEIRNTFTILQTDHEALINEIDMSAFYNFQSPAVRRLRRKKIKQNKLLIAETTPNLTEHYTKKLLRTNTDVFT